MAKTTLLTISTPNGKVFTHDVLQVNADISEGRIGVFARHTPLVSSLKIALFNIKYEDGTTKQGVINGGIFNVTGKEVTILTTDFVFKDEIDQEHAQQSYKRLKYMLDSELKPMEKKGIEERLRYNELKLKLFER